jgi:PAS domain S-box-containing protein
MRDVLASLPTAAAYLAGRDHVFEYVNDRYRQLVGDRPVLGLPVRQALPELADQGRFELLDKTMESGQPLRGQGAELWIRRYAQRLEQVFVDFAYQPVRDADGGVAGLLCFAADVTANVRAGSGHEALAAQLAATQERYQTLFETLPQGVVHYAADGSILDANPAACQIIGLDADEMTRWPLRFARGPVHEDGSPFQPADLPVAIAFRTGELVPETTMGIPHGRTRKLRWLGVTVVPDARDADGRPHRAYAMIRDVTTQRRAEATLREGTELMDRLRDANVIGMVVNGEDRVHEANDAFLDIVGYSREDLNAGRISSRSVTAPEWAAQDAAARQQLRRTGSFPPYEKEYLHRAGHRVPVLVGGAVIGQQPLRWVTYVVDLSARQRAEDDRATLMARERAARSEADNARERLEFLLRAGDFMAAARDRYELLQHASQLVVHSLADYCAVFLPAADGTLQAISVAYRSPSNEVVFADLRDQAVPTVAGRTVKAAYTTGTSQLLTDAFVRASGRRDIVPPLVDIFDRLKPENALVSPLMAGQRALGVLAVGRRAGQPRFAGADIAVLEELSRRIGIGLANADASARDHTVAETLQRSVLPDALPDIAGLDLAVRYLPGTDGDEVGGDWYDAFPVDGDRVGLVIGDVVGHSITSASIMAQLRNMLRAYAIDHRHPSDALRRTAAALSQLLPDALATVIYAILELGTGRLSYANAGHPPPVVGRADGTVEYLDDAPGVMLGAPSSGKFATGHCSLGPGDSLLLYTDGLIEDRRRDITEGLSALARAMRQDGSRTAEQTCAAVQVALLGSTQRGDDVCLLAARRTP